MSGTSIGLLGGTFDPPHVAHLVVADQVRVAEGLDEVRLLVAGDPYTKPGVTDADQRVEMARLACRDVPGTEVDAREARRPGPTYTVETLLELRGERPDVRWTFIVGADAAARLESWHRAAELVDLATVVVVTRPGATFHAEGPVRGRVRTVDVTPIEVSSSALRSRFAQGASVRHLVPPAVEAYVRRRGLYGAAGAAP